MGKISDERVLLPGLMSNLYDLNRVRYALEGINGPPVFAYVLFIFGLISLPFAREEDPWIRITRLRRARTRSAHASCWSMGAESEPLWRAYCADGGCRGTSRSIQRPSPQLLRDASGDGEVPRIAVIGRETHADGGSSIRTPR
jgi:hypothetical protein